MFFEDVLSNKISEACIAAMLTSSMITELRCAGGI